MTSKVSGDGLHLVAIVGRMLRVQTVIDMIVDKGTLGVDDGLFDRLQLMSDIQAGLSCLDHFYH